MKQIFAIIRMPMMNRTREALADVGVSGYTVRKVLGRGRGQVDFRVLSAAGEGRDEAIAHLKDDGPMLIPKRLINIVVSDEKVPAVVQALIKTNQTGKAGDGKIFVVPVAETIRVRTGERDEAALKE